MDSDTQKIILHTSIAVIFVCSIQQSLAAEEPPIALRYNLGGTESWVPFGYYGDPDKPGVFAEVIKLIQHRADHAYKFFYYPPKRAAKAFTEGRLDLDLISYFGRYNCTLLGWST